MPSIGLKAISYIGIIKIRISVLQKFTCKEIKLKFIEVLGAFLPCNNEVKVLGLIIDDKLKFDKQVFMYKCSQAFECNV